jgi:ribosome-binding factor A
MASDKRINQINSLLKEVISETIRGDMKNPNLTDLLTVTQVDTSRDLQHAKVFISIIEEKEGPKYDTIKILQDASSYIQAVASKKVSLRYFPSLIFKKDTSLDHYMHIDKILKDIESKKSHDENESCE